MKSNKSGLMLTELVIALVMFTFCAAICVRLFHFASINTRRAEELSHAIRITESVAEIMKSDENGREILKTIYPKSLIGSSEFRSEYSAEWEPVSVGDPEAAYAVTAGLSKGSVNKINVYSMKDGTTNVDDPIFVLEYMAVDSDE